MLRAQSTTSSAEAEAIAEAKRIANPGCYPTGGGLRRFRSVARGCVRQVVERAVPHKGTIPMSILWIQEEQRTEGALFSQLGMGCFHGIMKGIARLCLKVSMLQSGNRASITHFDSTQVSVRS